MQRKNIESLAKNALTYGLGQALNHSISFLLLPVFTSYLTPIDYGVISTLGLVAMIATPVFSLGLGTATGLCYFDGDDERHREKAIWTAFILLAVSVSLLALLAILFPQPVSQLVLQKAGYRHLVTLFLVGTCLSILTTPFMLYLQFEERAKAFVVLVVVSTVVSIGATLLTVVVARRGVQGFAEGRLIGQAASLLLCFLCVAPQIPFHVSRHTASKLLKFGVPLVPSFAFLFVLQHLNKYILQWYDGLAAVGIYTIGFNLGMAMNLLVAAFTKAWYPFYMSFSDKKEEARRLFGRVMTYYVLSFGTISLVFYIAARPTVMLMTHAEFHGAYKIMGLCASAQFLIGIFSIMLPGMYYAKDVKLQSVLQGIAAAVAVGVNCLLIPRFGYEGAAFALLVGFVALVVLQYLWNVRRKYLDVRYDWKRIAKFVLFYVATAALSLQDRDLSLTTEIVLALLGSAVLLLVLYTTLPLERQRLWAAVKRSTSGSKSNVAAR